MTNTDSGTLAATRQTWRAKSVRDLLAEIIAANPKASDDKLRRSFKQGMRDDDDFFDAVGDYGFDAALRALRNIQPPRTAKQNAVAATRKAEDAAAVAKLVAGIKGKALLKSKMLNGRMLRDCTGFECAHFGGWYQRIAARVGNDQRVGDVLSEKQVRAIYSEVTRLGAR
jgi:hypothetical protein